MNDKMSFEDFCYLVTSIIGEHLPMSATLVETITHASKIIVDGKTEVCKINFTINQKTLEYWYNCLYQCISSAEDMGDTVKYTPFWDYALKPYIITTLQSLLGKELITI